MAASKYGAMKKAFTTPGMQEGEKEAQAAIAKNRGVSMKKAAAIGKRRTAKGLNTAGVKGPKGMGPHDRKIARRGRSETNDPTGGRGTNNPSPAARKPTADRGGRATPTFTGGDPRLRIPPELIPGGSRTGGGTKTPGPGAPANAGPKASGAKDISKATGRARKQAK